MRDNIKQILETNYLKYNTKDFIINDPISIPHKFKDKEDIEIAGFFASIFAWGQRKTIISKSIYLLDLMDNEPYKFICNHSQKDLNRFDNFKHRTFNHEDCKYFIKALHYIYTQMNGLESLFASSFANQNKDMKNTITEFRNVFLSFDSPKRVERHIACPEKGSAAKKINMFLRWMVRNDANGVDFGLWQSITTADLIIPLDLHVGRIARDLGLLKRTSNDWLAAQELTDGLKQYDKNDPTKYDFALFGFGVNQK
ncbi:MAG: TIGR02757 family protein [Bacteroidetes bacterium GWE2_29_8]|nr:MAG: TIGR02757 family protein [Bacteroidetes bacterium GWE2_29_8]OFY20030.1 MAG: TIGR02757 family protein [Bacteroidetes bacterium GWF2_29_10]